MTGRRGLLLAIALLVAGGALLLLSGGRAWSTTTTRSPGFPEVAVSATGASVAPLVVATGALALAAAAALVAVRGWGRRLLGGVMALAGVATAVQVVSARTPAVTGPGSSGELVVQGSPWWLVAAFGAALVAAAGVLTVVRGREWPSMGARYERAGPSGGPRTAVAAERATGVDAAAAGSDGRAVDAAEAWSALDRGEDPTADRPN